MKEMSASFIEGDEERDLMLRSKEEATTVVVFRRGLKKGRATPVASGDWHSGLRMVIGVN